MFSKLKTVGTAPLSILNKLETTNSHIRAHFKK